MWNDETECDEPLSLERAISVAEIVCQHRTHERQIGSGYEGIVYVGGESICVRIGVGGESICVRIGGYVGYDYESDEIYFPISYLKLSNDEIHAIETKIEQEKATRSQ